MMKRLLFFIAAIVISFNMVIFAFADTSNSAADDEFQKFYDAIKHIEEDSKWNGFFDNYEVYNERHAERYSRICDSTTEEWNDKTDFEKFLFYETYLCIAHYMVDLSDYDRYFGSEKNFLDNMIDITYRKLALYDKSLKVEGNVDAEAYKTLMLWQYSYIQDNGVPYNFITGVNHLEGKQDLISVDSEKEKKEREALEQQEINEAYKELSKDMTESDYIGLSGETTNKATSSKIPIYVYILIIVAVVGISGWLYMLKSSNSKKNSN